MATTDRDLPDDCPLDRPAQTRNLLLFAVCTALQYLMAPVAYVGVVQAPLCKKLGSSDAVATLPETAFVALTVAPVFVTWLVADGGWLRRNLVACYAAAGLSVGAGVVVLASPLTEAVKV